MAKRKSKSRPRSSTAAKRSSEIGIKAEGLANEAVARATKAGILKNADKANALWDRVYDFQVAKLKSSKLRAAQRLRRIKSSSRKRRSAPSFKLDAPSRSSMLGYD